QLSPTKSTPYSPTTASSSVICQRTVQVRLRGGKPICSICSAERTGSEWQQDMANDDPQRNAEQTRSPGREYGGLPCKEHHCHWQQQVECQATQDPYQWIPERHQGWRPHYRH